MKQHSFKIGAVFLLYDGTNVLNPILAGDKHTTILPC